MKTIKFGLRSIPVALFLLCFIAYGLLLPRMGFYWDDWPWVWISHGSGPQGMLNIDRVYRPLAGAILWLGAKLAGQTPLGWQALNLLYRWMTGMALYWALSKIWPRQVGRSVWVAFLFLVYPGFTQQFVSVNSSRHILPMAGFFLSLGFMAWSIRVQRHYWLFTGISITLAFITMLSTEYYYGLELTRPVILWLSVEKDDLNTWGRLKTTLRYYTPYLILLLVVFAWRFIVARRVNYPVTLTNDFAIMPLHTSLYSIKTLFQNFVEASLIGWSKVFDFPARGTYGLRTMFAYGVLVIGSLALVFIYLSRLRDSTPGNGFWKQAVGLGSLALFVAGIPFLATNIEVKLVFPADRTMLPMMFGASLLFVGIVDGLFRKMKLKIFVISLAVSLAIGAQLLSAISYQKDWASQLSFLRQLTWRVPGLKPGTALFYTYTIAQKNFRSTDNSLTAPINWIYSPDNPSGNIPYKLYDLRLRTDSILPSLEKNLPITDHYGGFAFNGSTDNVLVMHYAPPNCLRVLHPQYDALNPQVPEILEEALPLANLDVIQKNPPSPTGLPGEFAGKEPVLGWCYYFEKADLARQFGDWQTVAEIGKIAFNLDDHPNHAAERVPFIQGFAYVGDWARAEEITNQTFKINEFTRPMLCSVWDDLAENAPDTGNKREVIQRVQQRLDCQALKSSGLMLAGSGVG